LLGILYVNFFQATEALPSSLQLVKALSSPKVSDRGYRRYQWRALRPDTSVALRATVGLHDAAQLPTGRVARLQTSPCCARVGFLDVAGPPSETLSSP